jgi:endonuclease/exonuclease/phosphatase family metal-dependent hydrolase
VLVAGDFNATEDSPQVQGLTGRWVDTYRVVHPDGPGYTCCVGDLSAGPGEPLEKRIDYVFLLVQPAHGVTVVESRRVLTAPIDEDGGWLWVSDHVGLVVEIGPEGREGADF